MSASEDPTPEGAVTPEAPAAEPPAAAPADAETPAAAAADAAAPVVPVEEKRRRKLILLLLLSLAFILLLAIAIWYLIFRQPINVIPPPPGGTVMPNYVTSIYGVTRPLGAAVTDDGSRIFIGETDGDRIAKVFDSGGAQVGLLQPPVSTGSSHVPVYLARNPVTNEIYVSDRPTAAIYVYDTSGNYLRQLNVPQGLDTWAPLGLAFDAAGNLYVTNVNANPQDVVKLDASGKVVQTFGTNEGMSFPNGVAVDSNGNVYVTDSNNGRLLVYSADGTLQAQVGRGVGVGNLGLPRGVAITNTGQVLVADATGQAIEVFSVLKSGEKRLNFLGSFGAEGGADGQFEYPNGLTLDGRGHIYIADSGNKRLQVWSY